MGFRPLACTTAAVVKPTMKPTVSLLNKLIGDFQIKNVNNWVGLNFNFASGVTLQIHSEIILEPEESTLIFGFFALAFVFFCRHFQKKQQRQSQTTTTS